MFEADSLLLKNTGNIVRLTSTSPFVHDPAGGAADPGALGEDLRAAGPAGQRRRHRRAVRRGVSQGQLKTRWGEVILHDPSLRGHHHELLSRQGGSHTYV